MKSIKTRQLILSTLTILGCALLFNVASVNALDEKTQLKLGETEYLNNCAACHGKDAKGNGPVAAVLTTKPFDLTMISKRFDGKYHRDFVYKVINGHEIISSHGDEDMAVWGDRYSSRASEIDNHIALPVYEQDNQAMVFGRIMSLVEYLESIQVEDSATK